VIDPIGGTVQLLLRHPSLLHLNRVAGEG
jgi:hypothetical protein